MTVFDVERRIVEIQHRGETHRAYDADFLEYDQAVLMGEVLQEIAFGESFAASGPSALARAALGVLSVRFKNTSSTISDRLLRPKGNTP